MSEAVIEYVQTEMRTFSEHPFHEVDSLILSLLSYIQLDQVLAPLSTEQRSKPIRIQQLFRAECFPHYFDKQPDAIRNRKLLTACAASPRFRDIEVTFFSESFDVSAEKQFCAMTFLINADTAYLAFRGTDSTLIGWKEDFNMAFLSPVPSQEEALSYTKQVAKRFRGRLFLGGHSKGGNLAIYAAMKCPKSIQDRMIAIFSHDGPGFRDNVFSSEDYLRISHRIHKTLPQSSLVGMLLEHPDNYAVVESTNIGILQHNPYSWVVRDGSFVKLESLTTGAEYMNRTLNDWLSDLSNEQREQFVDALYSVISTTNLSSLMELRDNWQPELSALVENMKTMDDTTKRILNEAIKLLMRMAVKNFPTHIQREQTKHAKGKKRKGGPLDEQHQNHRMVTKTT